MDKNSNAYVVIFAVVVCVICSAGLALTFTSLDPMIKANEAYDIQKNVLKACGLWDPVAEADKPRAELEALYAGRITELLVERESGELVTEITAEVKASLDEQGKLRHFDQHRYLSVYRAIDVDGEVTAYCLPTVAYGLWSWLYGFIALKPDCNEVIGITFYKDGETPGLGGEVNNLGWQKTWAGKKIFDREANLQSVRMIKGGINPDLAEHRDHGVDGLSGATITSDGVTRDLNRCLLAYLPYINKVRGN